MPDKVTHTVRLEPVGVEMEVDEGETVLDAAFRQGVTLMQFAAAHGDFVTPAIVAIAEGDYERNLANTVELFHILLHDPKEAEQNRRIVEDWLIKYLPACTDAANQLQPIWSQPRVKVISFLDPCKVTATSLRNAASVAKLVLTTRTLIADKPESYESTSGPCRGGGAGALRDGLQIG